MVFKPFSHLTRQSFAKSIAHGYAQPFVAASQSSYVASPFGALGSQSNNRPAKPGVLQFHNAFHNSLSSSLGASKAPATGSTSLADGGLAAYYAAWQQHRNNEEDSSWKQFQFPKRLEWRTPSSSHDRKGKSKAVAEKPADLPTRAAQQPSRRYSASDVLDLASSLTTSVSVPSSTAQVSREPVKAAAASTSLEAELSEEVPATKSGSSPLSESLSNSVETLTPPSSVSAISENTTSKQNSAETISNPYYERLAALLRAQHYGEIPAIFEAMLAAGVKPTPESYDSLLAAALNLPASQHQVLPKILDVYFDMLKRGVEPTPLAATTVLSLLAMRATEASEMVKSLTKRQARYGGMSKQGQALFRSNEAELEFHKEDKSIDLAIGIFAALPKMAQKLSTGTYDMLISACAEHGRIEDMLRFQACIEAQKAVPSGSAFVSMIGAFGATGDLRSAVECFNEYKSIATANDAGKQSLANRSDHQVYSALLKAYSTNGKTKGALRFYSKIEEAHRQSNATDSAIEDLRNDLIPTGLIRADLHRGSYSTALKQTLSAGLYPIVEAELVQDICVGAADAGDFETAVAAFARGPHPSVDPILAMLALNIRSGSIDEAQKYWMLLLGSPFHPRVVDATTMYALAHMANGNTEYAIGETRRMFSQARAPQPDPSLEMTIREDMDEALEVLGHFLSKRDMVLSATASVNAICAVAENGGSALSLANHALMSLGPEDINNSSPADLIPALQMQSRILPLSHDVEGHFARFAYMLRTAIHKGISFKHDAVQEIEHALNESSKSAALPDHFELIQHWRAYLQAMSENSSHVFQQNSHHSGPSSIASYHYDRGDDPYMKSTDAKGSTAITGELERNSGKSNAARLNEALAKFRNIRRAGRHPRYVTYAKLISAAAREGRANLVHELLAMAQADVPMKPQFESVRHGWTSILDAMVGSCLTLGDRAAAERYHQDLLDLGAAPSANTFGLYITTLKASTNTFDEASEAVKIFLRARSEGVEPTSFLYNALIGKLGKARRIDDCLLYFTEMRARGIRPTSVTYGTIVNALCRVSDETFAEEIFEEMESMPNYKPRPAPYNSLIQFLLNTKRDRSKVLTYYRRMQSRNIEPTMHTYKLLIDSYAMLEPVDMAAAEGVLQDIYKSGQVPEAVHYASLVHAKGCVQHDMSGALKVFEDVAKEGVIKPHACLYQALFEAMVANHAVKDTSKYLEHMRAHNVEMTAYIANTLIHGWALENNVDKAKEIYDALGREKREPSTYDAMTRAFLTAGERAGALEIVKEMTARGYPSAVAGKVTELVGGRSALN